MTWFWKTIDGSTSWFQIQIDWTLRKAAGISLDSISETSLILPCLGAW